MPKFAHLAGPNGPVIVNLGNILTVSRDQAAPPHAPGVIVRMAGGIAVPVAATLDEIEKILAEAAAD